MPSTGEGLAADGSRSTGYHTWRFFRAGGFDQVRLDSGADLAHLDVLDQKLWVALACPTRGIEFDPATLDLIDTDHDGRIRAPEIIAAAKWLVSLLKNPDTLMKGDAGLEVDNIQDATAEGKQVCASVRQILLNLGKAEASRITLEDTSDTTRIFAQTTFNGDGVIPVDAAEDAGTQGVIADMLACLPARTDRSGKPGVDLAMVERFYTEARALAEWANQPDGNGAMVPLGSATAEADAAVRAVRAKVDDYFARVRLAEYDARALAAVNRLEAEYVPIAAQELSRTAAEAASFPLARVEAHRPLPLTEGLNPAWAEAMAEFRAKAVTPLLGDKTVLSEADWRALTGRLAPFAAWQASKPATSLEKLGVARVREILASSARQAIGELLAKDQALEAEANAIANVDRLLRYHRDLYRLLNNFVAFRDFYARKDKAVFQVGTLYLDQRSCDLCVHVNDPTKHAAMAHLAYTYLVYCDCVRKSTGDRMTIAAAFTAGDSDNLMVGRNGLFYDRKGRDYDATITKIVEHPISIRQAFWAPYKRVARFISETIAKRAAAADAAAQTRLQAATVDTAHAATTGVAPPPPPAANRVDVGVIAAMGVAVGAITTAFGVFLTWLSAVPTYYLPVYMVVVLLAISTPSVILAVLKLGQRNLGPILDANGWAINTKARINIPFGGALTRIAVLPPGAQRDMFDPFAEKRAWPRRLALVAMVIAGAWAFWYFGVVEMALSGMLPESSWVKAHKPQPSTQPATGPATNRGESTTKP